MGRQLLRQSLKTKSIEIAEIKLRKLLKTERAKAKASRDHPHTIEFYAQAYLTKVAGSGIKPRSVDYRRECWKMIQKQCDGISARQIADITPHDCEDYAAKLRSYSGGRFNGCLETLRGIFRCAVVAGACVEDPTTNIDRAPVPIEPPRLPSQDGFSAMLRILAGQQIGNESEAKARDRAQRSKGSLFTVQLLAFTGLRIDEARHLVPNDVDLKTGWITVRVTKNGEQRRVPIIEEARQILQQFIGGARVVDPRRALGTASANTLTPHDLRHLFATRCLESGVDVRTVAGWLGHRDGGALLLRRYAHLRDEHSKQMAAKVKFA